MEITKEISEARKRVIAGKTWLVVQLMQGYKLRCHHSKNNHFAELNGKAVTEVHHSEITLAEELREHHDITFLDLKCYPSVGDIEKLATEWVWM